MQRAHCLTLFPFLCLGDECSGIFKILQRCDLMHLLLSALADGARANADAPPGARAACLVAVSLALHRLHARCVVDVEATPGLQFSSALTPTETVGYSEAGPPGFDETGVLCCSPVSTTKAAATTTTTDTARSTCGLPLAEHYRGAWGRKQSYARGAQAFNKKPREGLKLLQAEGLLGQGAWLEAREVARFLRFTQGLDKTSVGSYLGEAGMSATNDAHRAALGSSQRAVITTSEVVDTEATAAGTRAVSTLNAEDMGPHGKHSAGALTAMVGKGQAKDTKAGRPILSSETYMKEQGIGKRGPEKTQAGVYRGDTAEFHAEVLEAFVESFDFRGQQMLASLRMFLEAFRLPGEAQQIDRILHVSDEDVFWLSGDDFGPSRASGDFDARMGGGKP